jgi:hypothetical protein
MANTKKSSRRKRVFVIGAGVSASCGIPIARDILRYAILDLRRRNAAEAARVHSLLRFLYPAFDDDLGNYPNIEDFLNFIEVAKDFNQEFVESTMWSADKLRKVSRITLKAVTDYIWTLMGDVAKQHAVSDFVRNNLVAGDTIITFNWDLTIERALEEYPGDPGFEYRYSRTKRTDFVLLKPHGSVDWFERKKIRGLKCERAVEKHDHQLCYYPEFDLGSSPELKAIAPVIVPPVSSKTFTFDFFHRTWGDVLRSVSDARELHVLGYSLPKEDSFAKFVFRRAIRNNITSADKGEKKPLKLFVVNPDEAVEQTFYRLVGKALRHFNFYQARFEDVAAKYNELIPDSEIQMGERLR